ncbi:MAG: histidine kinase dimerization/phospho-acceptor domain-containing protein [Actinomycetota bacterium]
MEQQHGDGLVTFLSHDLKTPLGPLTLAVSNLAEGSCEAGETQGLARIALAQTQRLRRLIDAALIASGRMPMLESRPVNVSSILVDASIRYEATGGQVTHDPFPVVTVRGDRATLCDAVAGLFEVAAGDVGVVSVQLRLRGDRAEIVIAGADAESCARALSASSANDSHSVFAIAAKAIVSKLGGGVFIGDEGVVVSLPAQSEKRSEKQSEKRSEPGTAKAS